MPFSKLTPRQRRLLVYGGLAIAAAIIIGVLWNQLKANEAASRSAKALALANSERLERITADVKQGREARRTVCEQANVVRGLIRSDKEDQIKKSEEYLAEHPNGAPGIPAQLIREGIRTQRHQRYLARDIDCDWFALHPAAPPRYIALPPV